MRQLVVKESKWLSPSLCGNCTVLEDGKDHEIETFDLSGDDVLVEIYNGKDRDMVRDMMAEEQFKKFCMAYTAGYIVQNFFPNCVLALRNNERDPLNSDIVINLSRREKNKNKLVTYPSHSVYQLVLNAERVFEHWTLIAKRRFLNKLI